MSEIVWWHTKRLAKEFNMRTQEVGKMLKSIGAKSWSKNVGSSGSVWYYEKEGTESD